MVRRASQALCLIFVLCVDRSMGFPGFVLDVSHIPVSH